MNISRENLRILIRYSEAIGCDGLETFEILLNTKPPEAQEELINLCKEKLPTTPEEILEMSWQIYLKYRPATSSIRAFRMTDEELDEEAEEYGNTEADYPEETDADYQEDERPESTEPIYYLETADGDVMRVPESRLADFEAMNERRREEKERNAASSHGDSSPEDKPKR